MKRGERFLVQADVELNVTLWCRVCQKEFWSTGPYVALGVVRDAVKEHEDECKEQNAAKSKSSKNAGQDSYPLNLC